MPSLSVSPGFKLSHTLVGHTAPINQIAWSPNGRWLASASSDATIRIWNMQTGEAETIPVRTPSGETSVNGLAWSQDGTKIAYISVLWAYVLDLQDGKKIRYQHPERVESVVFTPDSQRLIVSCVDKLITVWDLGTRKSHAQMIGHTNGPTCLAWQPHHSLLASGSMDSTIRIWDGTTNQCLYILTGHTRTVYSVAWSQDGSILASGAGDQTIRLWTIDGGAVEVLEGHTDAVIGVSFSADAMLLASKSLDGTVRLWDRETWQTRAILEEPSAARYLSDWFGSLAFHPSLPILATLGERDTLIRIWDLDFADLPSVPRISYRNAKVVLVGDTGVGKSGLSLALSGQPFMPTESTHGRHVWTFDLQRNVNVGVGRRETREVLLWDLAGQPGYRLIHQLYLNEIAIALVVFDSRSETDPFAGVHYWVRALRQAHRVQGHSAPPLKLFLVAARADRGGISASQERIKKLVLELGFDGFFETSAKEGWQIQELASTIRAAILWNALPRVSSSDLFQRIKDFLLEEKGAKRILATVDSLYRAFRPLIFDRKSAGMPSLADDLQAQFETCVGRVETRGLIRRLSFGGFVLLQPEILDAYASALVNAARTEPEGLGSINEEDARVGRFNMSEDERIRDKELESLLLIATVEDLLRYEISLRESTDLVFPAQFTRENPALPDPEGEAVVFTFEGPIFNIYTTLAVRLAHSEVFRKNQMWRNAATYTANTGGICGIFLREIEEGRAELKLFFENAPREAVRFQFEQFVAAHIQRRALPSSIRRRRIFACPNLKCKTVITDQQTQKRREFGFHEINCPACDTRVLLVDGEERLTALQEMFEPTGAVVDEMEKAANHKRDLATAMMIAEGKHKVGDYDVFLCHTAADRPAVKRIAAELKSLGILPWLDEWALQPGRPWRDTLERQIGQIKSAAVFIGPSGIGPWEDFEAKVFLREFVRRGAPVIPVILPKCAERPEMPKFLAEMLWVDFRKADPDPFTQLVWGITGQRLSDPGDYTFRLLSAVSIPSLVAEVRASVRDEIAALRADLLTYTDASTQMIINRLDDAQLSLVRELWAVAESATIIEARQIMELLIELRRNPPAGLAPEEIKRLPESIEGPQFDVQHALKVCAPIIPMILSYEGTIQLRSGIDLKTELRKWLQKRAGNQRHENDA